MKAEEEEKDFYVGYGYETENQESDDVKLLSSGVIWLMNGKTKLKSDLNESLLGGEDASVL